MQSENLLYMFNNRYERQSRHVDTYFTDKPGMTNDEIIETNNKNIQALIRDTLQQIASMPDYFEGNEDIREMQDFVYKDVITFNSYENIEDFINDMFIKNLNEADI